MPESFNLNIKTPSSTEGSKTVVNGQTQGQGSTITRKADAPVVRNIAPLTDYNPETGMREIRSEEPPVVEKKDTKTSSEERQAKWKEEQAEKKLARQEQANKRAAEKQSLARELLFKGDLAGAAKALDMSPTDLATYVDNARLAIPNKKEEVVLTPEQIRAKEDADWKAERKAFEQEQAAWKYSRIKSDYIKDKIAPALADKDKYEFIHKQGADKIQDYIYEYANKHFQETGEELNPADLADAIEEQMVESYTASVKKLREMKKMAQFFTKEEQEEMAEEEAKVEEQVRPQSRVIEPTLNNRETRPLNSRFDLQEDETEKLIREAEEEEQKLLSNTPVRKSAASSGKKTPFALLSREERLLQMKAERNR
jgi:hypothetical protein